MDAVIAHMAKLSRFDAALYTWVLLDPERIFESSPEEYNELLINHGDYATPLDTGQIRMPFEHIAVVMPLRIKNEPITLSTQYTAVTLDCVDSRVKYITHWAHKLIGKSYVACRTTLNPGDTPWLFEANPALSESILNNIKKYAAGIDKRLVRYIALASAGLLAGEQPTYHLPKAIANNAKRIKKGKAPLYEWTTLQLERKTPELPAAPKGGTHASPRLHQRRGHWVTSKLGKKFWRRESVVGDPEKGMIFHDYKDGGRDARH